MGRPGVEIILNEKEYQRLKDYSSKGIHPAKLIKRANVMLDLDTSHGKRFTSMEAVGQNNKISRKAVADIKNAYLALGVDGVIQRKRRATPPVLPKIDGDAEAHLIALCCSEPPEGYARWSVRLLADKMVELEIMDSVSHMTVQRVLKKRNLSLT